MCACTHVLQSLCIRSMMYDTDQCHTHLNLLWVLCVCVRVCVWEGVFPYGALCGLFWWDCALCVYSIPYLGSYEL